MLDAVSLFEADYDMLIAPPYPCDEYLNCRFRKVDDIISKVEMS